MHTGKPGLSTLLVKSGVQNRWELQPKGSISANGPSGEADLAIPVSGPMGSCSIYAVAKKTVGRWEYQILEAECENEPERINLLPAEAEMLDSS